MRTETNQPGSRAARRSRARLDAGRALKTVALHPAGRLAGLILGYLVLTVLLTWPLAAQAGRSVQDLGDPLYDIWNMRIVQHQLASHPGQLWDGRILYPFPDTLLFSEPQLSTSLLAWPVQLLTGNAVLAYDLMFLLSFVVMGVGLALLVAELSGSLGAGFLAGSLAAFTPYRFGHISHLNLLSFGWLPLALWALIRFGRRRRLVDAALAALFLTLQLLASDTLAVLSVGVIGLLLPFLVWEQRQRLDRRLLLGLGVCLLLPGLALLPVVVARLEVNRLYGFARDLATVRELASTWRSYLSVSPFNQLWRGTLPALYPSPLFPGAVALLGGLAGLALSLRARPAWTLFALGLALSGVLLSLGPETTIAGQRLSLPYRWLYDWLPGFATMRDPARFGMVALLGLQLLAGLGFAAAWRRLGPRLSSRLRVPVGVALLLLLTTAVVVESRSDVHTAIVPNDPGSVAVYDWLARQPPGPVLELPANGIWTDVTLASQQMYHLTQHWHPIVGGYSSFYPPRYLEFLTRFHGGPQALSGPDLRVSEVSPANVGLLQDLGVRYVIIHQRGNYDWQRAVATAATVPDLIPRGQYGEALAFELRPGQRTPLDYRLSAPRQAIAGRELVAVLAVRNANPTSAAGDLRQRSQVRADWLDAGGRRVVSQRVDVDFAVVDPGLTALPVRLAAPRSPGDYRLRLSYPAGEAAAELPVQLVASAATRETGPPGVSAAEWPANGCAPGGQCLLTLNWQAGAPLTRSYTVSVQLIGPDGRLHGQWDGLPYRGDWTTERWRPGSTLALPVELSIPTDAPPGRYQAIAVLYDGADPTLPRLPLAHPDGTLGTEVVLGTVEVR